MAASSSQEHFIIVAAVLSKIRQIRKCFHESAKKKLNYFKANKAKFKLEKVAAYKLQA
jgi:hypothetical protein